MKNLFFLALFGVLAVSSHRFCNNQTSGFSIAKIHSSLPYHPGWEVETQENFGDLFLQEYAFLGSGAQTFAFESEDGQYVLKFFDHNKKRTPFEHLMPLFPAPLKKRVVQTVQKRRDKLHKDFSSYIIAYREMREETGLLMLHLNKTDHLHREVTLIDPIGIRHKVNLDQLEFVVQKRAQLLYPCLERWVDNGELDRGKIALTNVVELLKTRMAKGIFDKDPNLMTNFGLLDLRAIQIDPGRFRYEKRTDKEKEEELIRITDRLYEWLEEYSPALAKHLALEVNR